MGSTPGGPDDDYKENLMTRNLKIHKKPFNGRTPPPPAPPITNSIHDPPLSKDDDDLPSTTPSVRRAPTAPLVRRRRTPSPPLPPSDSIPSPDDHPQLQQRRSIQTTVDGEVINMVDCPSPPAPAQPSPPPPGPQEDEGMSLEPDIYVDVEHAPPNPSGALFSSINKAPRNTASSTTFTVSGHKITIIGHARCGKTSLKNALFGREFKDMTFPTVTAPPKPAIMMKKLAIVDEGDEERKEDDDDEDNAPDAPDGEVDVQYEIWDTPGQKVLEYIPPLYITGSFCVFIVYDITDDYSFQRARYWVTYLEDHAKGYENIVLIGNKYDLHGTQRSIESDMVQSYADEHGIFFIEISVKTKHNFDVLLCWLEQKTQEKLVRQIKMEEIVEEEKDGGNGISKNGGKKGKGRRKEEKKRRKSLLRRHQSTHQTIQLDQLEMKGVDHHKKKACCSISL